MLISILACSLGLHAITFERSTFMKIAILKSSQCGTEPRWYRFLAALLHVVAENVVTDRWMDRQTDGQTDLQTKYCNPRCACAPRVN